MCILLKRAIHIIFNLSILSILCILRARIIFIIHTRELVSSCRSSSYITCCIITTTLVLVVRVVECANMHHDGYLHTWCTLEYEERVCILCILLASLVCIEYGYYAYSSKYHA